MITGVGKEKISAFAPTPDPVRDPGLPRSEGEMKLAGAIFLALFIVVLGATVFVAATTK